MRTFTKFCYLLVAFFSVLLSSSIAYSSQTLPLCIEANRECAILTANAYLKGLLAHDAQSIPLADDAERLENGIKTGVDAQAIRDSINNDYSLKAAKGIRDLRWFVDGNQVIAFYLLDVVLPYTEIHAGTTRIAERFQIDNGLIKEIEVIFCNSPGIKPEARETKGHTSLSFICTRA